MSDEKKLQKKIKNLRKQLWDALKNRKAILNLPKKEWDQKMRSITGSIREIFSEIQRTGKEKLKRKIGGLKKTLSEIETLIDGGEISPEKRKKLFFKLIRLIVSVTAFWFFF